jgi:hypothetical protein
MKDCSATNLRSTASFNICSAKAKAVGEGTALLSANRFSFLSLLARYSSIAVFFFSSIQEEGDESTIASNSS